MGREIQSVIWMVALLAGSCFTKSLSQTSPPSPGTAAVSFILRIPKLAAEDFVLAGDGDALGNWDIKRENKLNQENSTDVYVLHTNLKRGEDYEFKVAVVDSQNLSCKCVMPGPNGDVEVPVDSPNGEVVAEIAWDNDCSDPASCSTSDPCDVSDPCASFSSLRASRRRSTRKEIW